MTVENFLFVNLVTRKFTMDLVNLQCKITKQLPFEKFSFVNLGAVKKDNRAGRKFYYGCSIFTMLNDYRAAVREFLVCKSGYCGERQPSWEPKILWIC